MNLGPYLGSRLSGTLAFSIRIELQKVCLHHFVFFFLFFHPWKATEQLIDNEIKK